MIFKIIGTEQSSSKDMKKVAIIIALIAIITTVSVISVIVYANSQSNHTNGDDLSDFHYDGDTDTEEESPGWGCAFLIRSLIC